MTQASTSRNWQLPARKILISLAVVGLVACTGSTNNRRGANDVTDTVFTPAVSHNGPVAEVPTGERLRLVFYADVHATADWSVPEAMHRAADAINAAKPDLVIAGGDLISADFSSTEQQAAALWSVYARLHRRIEAPIYTAIGNHDLIIGAVTVDPSDHDGPRRFFLKNTDLASTYYTFDAGGYHFIVLDTVEVIGGRLGYQGGLDDTQRAWLVADLERTDPDTPLVLVSHIPLLSAYPAATHGWLEPPEPDRVITNADELLDLFEGHRLELVLQGHLHVFETIEWRGTTFVTGGAISGNWWKGSRLGTEEGFCVIELGGDGVAVRYQAYDWDARRD